MDQPPNRKQGAELGCETYHGNHTRGAGSAGEDSTRAGAGMINETLTNTLVAVFHTALINIRLETTPARAKFGSVHDATPGKIHQF